MGAKRDGVKREPTILCGASRQGLFSMCARLRAGPRTASRPCHARGFAMLRRTFKYRLYPNRQQREKLQANLDVCRELYNAALQERREAWSLHRKGIHYIEQANQLPDIKAVREDVRAVHSQVLQDVLRRIDKAFQAFFLRCKRGRVAGFLAFVPRAVTTPSPIRRPGSNSVAACRFRRLATSRLSFTALSKARSERSPSSVSTACGMPVSVVS